MEDITKRKSIFWVIVRTILPSVIILLVIWGLIQIRLAKIIENSLLQSEKLMVVELTNTAYSLLENYQLRVNRGELTQEDALERAKERLRNFRYGDQGNGYFWIVNSKYISIMHPFSGREGLSDYGLADEMENYYVRDIVQVALRDGSGFIEYMYPDPVTNTVQTKITYLRYFEPWDWIIGTGIYFDEIQSGILSTKKITNISLLVIFSIIIFWGIIFGIRKENAINKEAEALASVKHNEQQLINLFDNAFQFVGLIDQEGKLIRANKTALDFIKKEQNEVAGKYFWETPWWSGDPVTEQLTKNAILEALSGQLKRLELKNYGNNHQIIHVDVSFKPIFDDEHHVYGVIVEGRDITELIDAQNLIYKQVKFLNSLRMIDQTIINGDSIFEISSGIFHQIFELVALDAAALWRYDEKDGVFTNIYSRGFKQNLFGKEIRFSPSSAFISQKNTKTVDPELFKFLKQEKFRSCGQHLLLNQSKIIGMLQVFTHREEPFTRDEQHILRVITEQSSIAIENISMVNDLRTSNQNLLLAYDHTLEGWAKALGVRDNETQGHSERVTELTVRLAKKIGIRGDELTHIRRGAILHDVGKIGIPDRILLKPGKLTDEEWETMRLHPVYAFQFLSPIPFLKPALDIPYCHHEWWNGKGYPRGLVGEQIPIAARIFSIIDVWDALTNDRPYRLAWPEEKVLSYIQELEGVQFDPMVVQAFLTLIDEEINPRK